MVDNNNNQWEEIEYTEDNTSEEEELGYDDDDSYEEEVAQTEDENGEEYEEYEEYEDEEEGEEKSKKKSPIPIIAALLALLIIGGAVAVPKLMSSKEDKTAATTYHQEQTFGNGGDIQNSDNSTGDQGQDDLANSFFDAANNDNGDMMSVNFNENGEETNVVTGEGENQQIATVTQPAQEENNNNTNEADLFDNQDNSQANDSIMVVYNKAARLNPFKPPVIPVNTVKETSYGTVNNTQFEIIEPPTASVPDENLTKLLQTTISGIMYDSESPSAIVNLNGVDQFVKVGDVISGYKIESITKDKVQISYKNNSYVASVGELFSKGYLDKQQAIVNLDNKFGGRYKNNNN